MWVSIIQVFSFVAKVGATLFFFIWIRWTVPRFRYDQLMDLGWKVMLPLALVNLLYVAGEILLFGL
jgi:NADH-quinone oxidoreductase subunit H